MRARRTGTICMVGSGASALALAGARAGLRVAHALTHTAGCGTYTAAKAALACTMHRSGLDLRGAAHVFFLQP